MLVETLLRQLGRDLDLSVERDIEVIRYRCEHEGFSFLTITLPLLSDALERGLEDGRLAVPSQFGRNGSLPRLLGGFFKRVFARTGEPLDVIDPDCVFAIRQIARFFKKLKMACSEERELEATLHYIEVEKELGRLTPSIRREDNVLDKVAGVIWSQVFPEIDPLEIVCQHGPGVTADRLGANQRFQLSQWYDRFEHTFPSDLHAFPNYGWASEASGIGKSDVLQLKYLGVRDEPGVRVVFVPKTQKTPRVIAIEPSCMQYVQQGLMHYIVPRLESHRLTKHSVRFADQSVNQRLAHRSSIDRSLATLDLKDASDRVHLELVRRIFRTSGILEYLEDARSLHAVLPNGVNCILNKYASMGSALCFPVEAMVFYTLIQAAMHDQDGKCPTSSSIYSYSKLIDIYGDDIIVPVDYTDVVVRKLEAYGLKVNISKSFRSSLFRESCGGDFYNGYSVKPVYARMEPPDDVRSWTPQHVTSWVSTANQLYELGMWKMAQKVRDMVEEVVGEPIQLSSLNRGSGLYFKSAFRTTGLRYNSSICGYEQRRIVYQPTKKKDDIDGLPIPCLNKAFSQEGKRFRVDAVSSRKGRTLSSHETALPNQGEGSFDILPIPCGTVARSLDVDSLHLSGAESYRGSSSEPSGSGGLPCIVSPNSFNCSASSVNNWSTDQSSVGNCSTNDNDLAVHCPSIISTKRCAGDQWTPQSWTGSSPFLIEGESITVSGATSLDFKSSVKRGGFKSKRRWVTLIT